MKKVENLQTVRVFAAFPEKGAFYSGATGKVIKTFWQEEHEKNPEFVTVKMDGSGDVIPVHRKQLRKAD